MNLSFDPDSANLPVGPIASEEQPARADDIVSATVSAGAERLAGGTIHGLAAGLFTRDLSRALRLARRLQAGAIWINRHSRSRDHILPTGGYNSPVSAKIPAGKPSPGQSQEQERLDQPLRTRT